MRLSAGILLLAVVAACTKAPPPVPEAPKPPPEIRVGVVAPLTGPNASFGNSVKNGIDLALGEVNANGGIAGKKLRAIHLDDQGRTEEAKTAAQRLITKHKIDLLLGEVSSGASLVLAPIFQRAQIPMITPSATHPAVTETGDFVFRVCFIDPFQGFAMAKFAVEGLKLKRIAVLRDVSSEYSVGLADAFSEQFKKLGGEIVGDESYTSQDEDFVGVLTSIAGSRPEAVYVPGYYAQVEKLATAAKAKGISLRMLGGDGWDSDELLETAGEALEGAYFTNHYHTDDPRPEVAQFVERYRNAYNEAPDAPAALGYDAARLAIDALSRAGKKLDHVALKNEIAKTQTLAGVTGKIRLDAQRNAVKPAVIIQIKDKKRQFVTTIEP